TRMLVPAAKYEEALRIAKATAEKQRVGDPWAKETTMGPVVSEAQFNKIQTLLKKGIAEGAIAITGGPGRPEGLDRGYYVRPTVFAKVSPAMTIAREEIFGPVLVVMPYNSVDEAVEIANDSVYGLAAYIQSSDLEKARAVAARLRAGTVSINHPSWNTSAP